MLINSEFTYFDPKSVIKKSKLDTYVHGFESRMMREADIDKGSLKLLLSQFEPHGLNDINNANLMQRVDTKYLLPIRDLKKLLMLLAPSYTMLEIGKVRLFSYRNTYYDTSGLGFYLMHHNGKRNRYKIRLRHYVDSGVQYVEVKHKSNKSVTQKDRVLFNRHHGDRDRINALVSMPFGENRPPLFKSLVCSYSRIALADETNGERLSLDFNLSFKDPNNSCLEQSNRVLIAEVKRANEKAPSIFVDLMGQFRKKPVSFSKYCIGCAQIHSGRVKTNRFKATLMSLAQISHEETGAAASENNLFH